jgi:tetratricopeptide (TPR) repeat protein
VTSLLATLLLLALNDPTPRAFHLLPESGALALGAEPSVAVPASLTEGRKLADQLRYEEAVVEYQKYLALPERPQAERAQALFELGFISLVLGDDANAQTRAQEALELEPRLALPPGAPPKQAEFLSTMRKQAQARARLTLEPRAAGDAPGLVRVKLADPERRVKRVLLRHGFAQAGPFASVELTCDSGHCEGALSAPKDASSFTAWYFVEALDGQQLTQARVGSPEQPLQLAVVEDKPWYRSPVVWGVSGAALVAIATVVYFLAPQPPK